MQLENIQVDEPVPAENEETTETPQGDGAPVADSAPAAKKPSDSNAEKNPLQSRFDEITRRRYEAERRADAAERELAQLRQGTRKQDPEPSNPQLKTLADFEFDEGKYQIYLFGEAETRAEKRAVEAATKLLTERQDKDTADKRAASFKQREREFSKQNSDYFEKTYDKSLPFNEVMVEAMADSEEGPAIAYYLANNADIAEQISYMSPYAAAREIGKIEATLVTERKKSPERVASKAPPPVPKIEGSADAALPKSLDDPTLSDAEYNKLRRKQIAAKHKR